MAFGNTNGYDTPGKYAERQEQGAVHPEQDDPLQQPSAPLGPVLSRQVADRAVGHVARDRVPGAVDIGHPVAQPAVHREALWAGHRGKMPDRVPCKDVGRIVADAAVALHRSTGEAAALDVAVQAVPVKGRSPRARVGERRVRGVAGNALGLVVAGGAGLPVGSRGVSVQVLRPPDGVVLGRFAAVAALAVVPVGRGVAEGAPLVDLGTGSGSCRGWSSRKRCDPRRGLVQPASVARGAGNRLAEGQGALWWHVVQLLPSSLVWQTLQFESIRSFVRPAP